MARICYVILAHSEPINLLGLVGSLWNREDAFSIWVDAKADEDCIRVANALTGLGDNVKTSLGRVMSWGGFSVVDTTLMAYSGLHDQFGDFSHVVLCSGTHIPLLHPDLIYEKIRNLPGWMDFCEVAIPEGGLRERDNLPPGWVRDILTRVRYHYVEVPSVGMLPTEERHRWIGTSVLEGSQWHVLRGEIIDFIVGRQSEIRENFRDVRTPDEHAFQWIVSQAPGWGEFRLGDHVWMQWEGALPRRLSFSESWELAALKRFLFARKARVECSSEEWIAWARDSLENVEGARQLQDVSAALRLGLENCDMSDRTVPGESLCDLLLAALGRELSAAFGCHVIVERRSRFRYVIDSGKRHARGGHLFFLCFAEPSLGIAVMPVLRHANLRNDDPMRSRPGPPSFGGFVNLPIGGRVGWLVGRNNAVLECKDIANSVSTEIQ